MVNRLYASVFYISPSLSLSMSHSLPPGTFYDTYTMYISYKVQKASLSQGVDYELIMNWTKETGGGKKVITLKHEKPFLQWYVFDWCHCVKGTHCNWLLIIWTLVQPLCIFFIICFWGKGCWRLCVYVCVFMLQFSKWVAEWWKLINWVII